MVWADSEGIGSREFLGILGFRFIWVSLGSGIEFGLGLVKQIRVKVGGFGLDW